MQVVAHHLLPADFGLTRHGRIAVARQVGQYGVGHALFAQGKQVNRLRAARRFGRIGQPVLLRQGVDACGFTGIRPANKGDFRHIDARQVLEFGCSRQKFGCVQPPHGDFGVGFGLRKQAGRSGHGVLVGRLNTLAAFTAMNPL